MRSIVMSMMVISVALGAALFALARTADAAHVLVVTSVSDRAEVGRPVELRVALSSIEEALPVPNALVTAYADASFGGVTGEVELGSAVTDENGIAAVNFEPRSAGDHEVRLEYLAPGGTQPEVATTTISVASASQQLHRSTSGIQVPGLNVWLIITLVALVWFILFSVGLRVVAIARATADIEPILERAPRLREMEPHVAAREAGTSEA